MHKDIKELVTNVTDNETKKLISKKPKVKCKPKLKDKCPQGKSSLINVPKQPFQNSDDLGKSSKMEANSKCIRALAPAFDGVEDMINRYNFESKQEIDLLHFWDLVQA